MLQFLHGVNTPHYLHFSVSFQSHLVYISRLAVTSLFWINRLVTSFGPNRVGIIPDD
jgi:hypothetical protein